jgi:hypothetical protein
LPTQSLVSVPALCSFEWQGRSYVRGEMVDVTALEASILARMRKVSLTKIQDRRGRYLRRDMRAER